MLNTITAALQTAGTGVSTFVSGCTSKAGTFLRPVGAKIAEKTPKNVAKVATSFFNALCSGATIAKKFADKAYSSITAFPGTVVAKATSVFNGFRTASQDDGK